MPETEMHVTIWKSPATPPGQRHRVAPTPLQFSESSAIEPSLFTPKGVRWKATCWEIQMISRLTRRTGSDCHSTV
jgi:hypothetical protein